MWKQLTLTLLTTTYLASSQELKVYFSEEEVQSNENEEGLNSHLLTIRLDKESLQPGVMERLSKTSNIIFADFPGLPEFVNAKEYEDILNTLYNDKGDQENLQPNESNSENSTDSMDDKKKEDDRHIEIIEEEPKRDNKEDYAKDTLTDDHKAEHDGKEKNNWEGKENTDSGKSEDDVLGDHKENEKDHKENEKDNNDEIKDNNDNKKDYADDNNNNKEHEESTNDHEDKDKDNKNYQDNDKKKNKNIVTSYTVPCITNATETGSVFKEKKLVNSTVSGFSTKTKSNSKASNTGYVKNQNATMFNDTNTTTIITEEENNSFSLSPVSMPLALLFATVTFMLTF